VPTLTLRTLGYPQVFRDGHPAKLTLRKGIALLIYLAEAHGPASRDQLAALFWPDNTAGAARAALRRTVHRVQNAVGEGLLSADRASLQWSLDTHVEVDAHEFERACQQASFEIACQRYSGEFLSGFSLADCPAFNDWAFFRRETLRGRFVQALERSIHASNSAGRHSAAITHAARLVAIDPRSEVSHRHLIRSLLLAGDVAAAQRHYTVLAQRLQSEHNAMPDEQTRELIKSPGA
jgi:DNA-binding SARP family transcriptional activator